ncbi:MAG: biotin synthase BioB [Candidatus Obscuribacterales bacterium]|nr:biotin synthase BioB [Candidatus Obscuribacterales bacterium]
MTGCCAHESKSLATVEAGGNDQALRAVTGEIRHDWSKKEIAEIYHSPLLELVFAAATVHRQHHDPRSVQQCTLLSVKTGGCSEDCSYCPQSARYDTGVQAEKLLDPETVYMAAKLAKESGSTRFCMGAAWREVKDNEQFDSVLSMVEKVKSLDMEVCVTLGMVNLEQAKKLKDAGVTAYNHNLDTGEEYYSKIISTRDYHDRLNTLKNVREAGITVCCGGIVGMGESDSDRIDLLHTLATMEEHPESVPVNALVAVEGTPLEDRPQVQISEMLRMIASARITMPRSVVRLSAGRMQMSMAEQALCFMAGANSIFAGDKLLTTANPEFNADKEMFASLGLKAKTLEQSGCC